MFFPCLPLPRGVPREGPDSFSFRGWGFGQDPVGVILSLFCFWPQVQLGIGDQVSRGPEKHKGNRIFTGSDVRRLSGGARRQGHYPRLIYDGFDPFLCDTGFRNTSITQLYFRTLCVLFLSPPPPRGPEGGSGLSFSFRGWGFGQDPGGVI